MDEDPLFELAVYLVASARLTLEEPVVYASFRLVEAALRVIDARSATTQPEDDFLACERRALEDGKLLMVDDPGGYAVWLDGILRAFAAEARVRNASEQAQAASA